MINASPNHIAGGRLRTLMTSVESFIGKKWSNSYTRGRVNAFPAGVNDMFLSKSSRRIARAPIFFGRNASEYNASYNLGAGEF